MQLCTINNIPLKSKLILIKNIQYAKNKTLKKIGKANLVVQIALKFQATGFVLSPNKLTSKIFTISYYSIGFAFWPGCYSTVFFFPFAVPEVTPANVSGGGGTKSELVITWEVSDIWIQEGSYLFS